MQTKQQTTSTGFLGVLTLIFITDCFLQALFQCKEDAVAWAEANCKADYWSVSLVKSPEELDRSDTGWHNGNR